MNMHEATIQEILIGSVLMLVGLLAPLYIFIKKRHLLQDKRTVYYLIAEIIFCVGLGLQFIFRINP
jgi:hypothetical protein